MEREKLNNYFSFPKLLDLSSYVQKKEENNLNCQYELSGVVVHQGDAYGGHYYSYIKD
jgi:ubiquitin carboxyl-terminal hydrolase 7